MGYTWGNYEFKTTNKDGKEEAEKGIYMTVWKKQKDGSWKVVADVGSPAPAK
jgi:ketosteroid isomerase-like protein